VFALLPAPEEPSRCCDCSAPTHLGTSSRWRAGRAAATWWVGTDRPVGLLLLLLPAISDGVATLANIAAALLLLLLRQCSLMPRVRVRLMGRC
jgi:hypothetical protein